MSEYDKSAVKMQGVSTIVAVPQWYINSNLADLLEYGSTVDGKSLKEIWLNFPGDGSLWLKGTLAKLESRVHVADAAKKVKFVLTFASGTMDYHLTNVPAPKMSTCDIAGLVFGFEVNLSHQAVQDDASLPADVKQAVTDMLKYTGPGAFTVQHLFMDLQNAALDKYDPTLTQWAPGMTPDAIAVFPQYIATYLAQLSQVNGNSLGYAIEVDDTAGAPATFPPTSLDYVTNQYQDGGAGNAALDTVDYLMMVDHKALPANLAPWSGNFIVPSDKAAGCYGTMAMAREQFILGFLLPQLAPLVNGFWRLKDQNGTLDCAYDQLSGTFTPTDYGGTFDSGYSRSHSHVTNTVSNDDVYYGIQTTCDLKAQLGTNTVVINRTTRFDIDYVHWYGLEGWAIKNEFHVWYEVPLTITLTLGGVMDGKLQVKSGSATTQPVSGVVYGDPYGWYIVRRSGDYSTWKSISSTTDSVINKMVQQALPPAVLQGITDTIEKKLNLTPFVFPGGAELFMRDAVFSDHADLLLQLQYKV